MKKDMIVKSADHISSHHTGIVLAAGTSFRMGLPKALLPTKDGIPLAQYQADQLIEAGCTHVVIVLGRDKEIIENKIRYHGIVCNESWEKGRISSVQSGLNQTASDGGYFSSCL
ncbi:MAG: NTP transferase domain-containing protein [Kiritimatiellae bacterium]|nr:NTP transferase domain-containing protein [Kiritimatiellia bacterium]